MSHAFPRYNGPVRLEDCEQHGPASGSEIIIVEGLSAAQAVLAVRDATCQAVLPMQGKPVNANKASRKQVMANPLFQALVTAVATPGSDGSGGATSRETQQGEMHRPSDEPSYERIILLCDPDADGIHCSALLLIFIAKYLSAWLEAGRVAQVHAPAAKVTWIDSLGKQQQGLSPTVEHSTWLVEQLELAGYTNVKRQHYRGLAGIDQDVLRRCCVANETRSLRQLTLADAELALRYFGGG